MKKVILIATAVAWVAFLAVTAAQQKPAPSHPETSVTSIPAPAPSSTPEKTKTEKMSPARMEKYAGTVEKVNETEKTIVVKGKKETLTFVVDNKTKIIRGGKDMPFAEVKKEMNVAVDYRKEGDMMVAASIRVAAPKVVSKEKTPETPAEKKPVEAPKK
jgi:hypothetical protein